MKSRFGSVECEKLAKRFSVPSNPPSYHPQNAKPNPCPARSIATVLAAFDERSAEAATRHCAELAPAIDYPPGAALNSDVSLGLRGNRIGEGPHALKAHS